MTIGDWDVRGPGGINIPGGHTVVLGKVRVGQQAFRRALLDNYGSVCAVTGPMPAAVLDAAHIYRYADRAEHDARGGLLLRRDVHALFDRHLLCIDPGTWKVDVAPSLNTFEAVWSMRGRRTCIAPTDRPSVEYVSNHAAACRARW